ncbi:MAG: T9SS type A sorting domain-containing protein [Bacteroidales bacterium]|nr:T9SS type A sorting domain-containing protein [Bacteroidales bacterium]
MTIDFIEIFNEEGQCVKIIKGNVTSIKVSELSKGLYFIWIHTEGVVVVRKFVKR